MKVRVRIASRAVSGICVLSLFSFTVSVQQAAPSVSERIVAPSRDDVLSRVRDNIAIYLASLPSFSSVEHVLSQELRKGRVIHETHLTSAFRVKRIEPPNSSQPLSEVRHLDTVDGKPVKNNKTYQLPLTVSGLIGNAFMTLFGSEHSGCYNYELESHKISSSEPFVLNLSLKPSSSGAAPCDKIASDATATVWLDPASFQIIRLDKRFPSTRIGRGFSDYRSSIRYSPITLNGKRFFLPESVTGQLSNLKSSGELLYSATYTDFHKYDATATILPVPGDDAPR